MALKDSSSRAREVDAFFYALCDDVIQVVEIMGKRGDELSRRLYVRTAFAFVEGIIQTMKSAALLLDEMNNPRTISSEEVAILKEEDIQLNEKGEIELTKQKIGLLQNFQFTLKTYAKVQRIEVSIDKGGKGWSSFRQAIRIRDRLTHPHALKDLEISMADLQAIEEGMKFFRESTSPLVGNRSKDA